MRVLVAPAREPLLPAFDLGVIVEKEQRRINKSARWTSREEEKVWVGFYRRVADPAVAADLIEQMEADREVKARHLGLYLRCRQSLRQDKVRRARARAVASMSQAIVHVACIRPLSVLGALWHFAGDVVNAWLMPSDEPAVRQMRKIQRSPPVPKEEASLHADATQEAKQA